MYSRTGSSHDRSRRFQRLCGQSGTHGGEWKDTESLRWEWQNGEMSFMEMEVFFRAVPRDQRSEYYLKEAVRYPGKQIQGGIRRRTESKL